MSRINGNINEEDFPEEEKQPEISKEEQAVMLFKSNSLQSFMN